MFSFDLSKCSGNVEFCIATWDVNERGTALNGCATSTVMYTYITGNMRRNRDSLCGQPQFFYAETSDRISSPKLEKGWIFCCYSRYLYYLWGRANIVTAEL